MNDATTSRCVATAVQGTSQGCARQDVPAFLQALLACAEHGASDPGEPVGISPPLPHVAPSAAPSGGSSGNSRSDLLPGLILLGVVVAVVLVVYAHRFWSARRRSLFGHVLAPGVGPDTCLVITDIEGSTHLWESLESHVMDRVMDLHDRCVRGMLAKFAGYEALNEGDSFISSFHTPSDALSFSLELQQTLLTLEWPAALLQQPRCAAVWVTNSIGRASRLFGTIDPVTQESVLSGTNVRLRSGGGGGSGRSSPCRSKRDDSRRDESRREGSRASTGLLSLPSASLVDSVKLLWPRVSGGGSERRQPDSLSQGLAAGGSGTSGRTSGGGTLDAWSVASPVVSQTAPQLELSLARASSFVGSGPDAHSCNGGVAAAPAATAATGGGYCLLPRALSRTDKTLHTPVRWGLSRGASLPVFPPVLPGGSSGTASALRVGGPLGATAKEPSGSSGCSMQGRRTSSATMLDSAFASSRSTGSVRVKRQASRLQYASSVFVTRNEPSVGFEGHSAVGGLEENCGGRSDGSSCEGLATSTAQLAAECAQPHTEVHMNIHIENSVMPRSPPAKAPHSHSWEWDSELGRPTFKAKHDGVSVATRPASALLEHRAGVPHTRPSHFQGASRHEAPQQASVLPLPTPQENPVHPVAVVAASFVSADRPVTQSFAGSLWHRIFRGSTSTGGLGAAPDADPRQVLRRTLTVPACSDSVSSSDGIVRGPPPLQPDAALQQHDHRCGGVLGASGAERSAAATATAAAAALPLRRLLTASASNLTASPLLSLLLTDSFSAGGAGSSSSSNRDAAAAPPPPPLQLCPPAQCARTGLSGVGATSDTHKRESVTVTVVPNARLFSSAYVVDGGGLPRCDHTTQMSDPKLAEREAQDVVSSSELPPSPYVLPLAGRREAPHPSLMVRVASSPSCVTLLTRSLLEEPLNNGGGGGGDEGNSSTATGASAGGGGSGSHLSLFRRMATSGVASELPGRFSWNGGEGVGGGRPSAHTGGDGGVVGSKSQQSGGGGGGSLERMSSVQQSLFRRKATSGLASEQSGRRSLNSGGAIGSGGGGTSGERTTSSAQQQSLSRKASSALAHSASGGLFNRGNSSNWLVRQLTSISKKSDTPAADVGQEASVTVAEHLRHLFRVEAPGHAAAPADLSNSLLLFRGLRVRIGMSTGVQNAGDVVWVKAFARTHYVGRALLMARLISGTGGAGAIVMCQSSLRRLLHHKKLGDTVFVDAGEHEVQEDMPPVLLYQACHRQMVARFGYVEPVGGVRAVSIGTLAAPLVQGAMALVHLVGAEALLSYQHAPTSSLLQDMFEAVKHLMRQHHGYLVHVQNGVIIGAFAEVMHAVRWAVDCHAMLKLQLWELPIPDAAFTRAMLQPMPRLFVKTAPIGGARRGGGGGGSGEDFTDLAVEVQPPTPLCGRPPSATLWRAMAGGDASRTSGSPLGSNTSQRGGHPSLQSPELGRQATSRLSPLLSTPQLPLQQRRRQVPVIQLKDTWLHLGPHTEELFLKSAAAREGVPPNPGAASEQEVRASLAALLPLRLSPVGVGEPLRSLSDIGSESDEEGSVVYDLVAAAAVAEVSTTAATAAAAAAATTDAATLSSHPLPFAQMTFLPPMGEASAIASFAGSLEAADAAFLQFVSRVSVMPSSASTACGDASCQASHDGSVTASPTGAAGLLVRSPVFLDAVPSEARTFCSDSVHVSPRPTPYCVPPTPSSHAPGRRPPPSAPFLANDCGVFFGPSSSASLPAVGEDVVATPSSSATPSATVHPALAAFVISGSDGGGGDNGGGGSSGDDSSERPTAQRVSLRRGLTSTGSLLPYRALQRASTQVLQRATTASSQALHHATSASSLVLQSATNATSRALRSVKSVKSPSTIGAMILPPMLQVPPSPQQPQLQQGRSASATAEAGRGSSGRAAATPPLHQTAVSVVQRTLCGSGSRVVHVRCAVSFTPLWGKVSSTTGRLRYNERCLVPVYSVVNAAEPGQILLSDSAYEALLPDEQQHCQPFSSSDTVTSTGRRSADTLYRFVPPDVAAQRQDRDTAVGAVVRASAASTLGKVQRAVLRQTSSAVAVDADCGSSGGAAAGGGLRDALRGPGRDGDPPTTLARSATAGGLHDGSECVVTFCEITPSD